MSFFISAAILCAIAMLFVIAPWLMKGRLRGSSRDDRSDSIIAIAKARLAEIERDFNNGMIGAENYQQLTFEQQRQLLQEADSQKSFAPTRQGRSLLLVFALSLPLFASVFYFYFGSWPDWQIQRLLDRSEQELQAGQDNRAALEALRKALEHRLMQRDDDQGRRRFMLARLDMEFGRYKDAVEQLGLLLKKYPEDANIAAQYTQALYLASNRKFTAEVLQQAQHVLQLDPNQTAVLGLLGIAAFEQKDFVQALLHWRQLLRLLPTDTPSVAIIEQGIKQAEQQLGPDGIPGPKITISVSLSAELINALPPHGTLFVFAKAVDGPPMPLAVARLDPARLPLEVTLDDSMAMAPGMNLSSAKQVQVLARITASGQVRAEPGDLEGSSRPLTIVPDRQKLTLQIDRRL
ncbi:MAG TPA: c-type cytochrome biogenesis protein CcmI [Spongiibacteraceae bacterium]